ncbi:MAG: family 16 glycoside hydrolase [Planctomycetota bacterium]
MVKNRTRYLSAGITIFLLLTVSIISLGQQDPPDKDWIKMRSNHYSLKTTASEADGRKLLDRMEIAYDGFSKLLGWTSALGKNFDVKVYKNRVQYLKGGAPSMSAAFYSPEERYLCGYFSKNKEKIYNIFAHEAIHQFHHMVFGRPFESMDEKGVPIWFDEGIAEGMGNSEVKNGKFRMCLQKGPVVEGRLPVIQRAIKNKKYFPLKDLIKLSRRGFMTQASVCYAEAWSFIHFLISYPKKEDKNQIYPAGDYFHVMGRLFTGLQEYTKFQSGKNKDSQFKTLDDVYGYAFVNKDGKTPINLDELEGKWKDYVLKFHYREGADEKKDEEAETLVDNIIKVFNGGKWSETKNLLDELRTKYAGTIPVTENLNDLNQMMRICDVKINKTESAGVTKDIKLFNGKDINNWKQNDDDDESSGWLIKDNILCCKSNWSYLHSKESSRLDSTIIVVFKYEGRIGPDKEPVFKICYPISESGCYVSAGINLNEKKVYLSARYQGTPKDKGYADWESTSLDKATYKANDWNALKLSRKGATISAWLNDTKIGAHNLDEDDIDKIGIGVGERCRTALFITDGQIQIKDITISYE